MANGDVIIFGNEAASSLIHYLLKVDSSYNVVGFTVDRDYMKGDTFEGLPIVAFDQVQDFFSPVTHEMIIPIGYHQFNEIRKKKYLEAKFKGYSFINYVSSRASVWPDIKIGENVLIYEHAIIQPFCEIGNNTIIRSGAHISHHCSVGDHCFVAAEVVTGGKVKILDQAFLGVGSVIVDSICIAEKSFIGAGAVITKPTESGKTYVGNPGRILEKKVEI